jgi:hypothetical protein
MQGWISLHRQIMENEFYFVDRFTKMQAWIDLLLLANHKPITIFIRGNEINLKEGQLAYSQLSLAKRWKWNRKTVDKFLSMLQNREMLDNRKTRLTTIISIRKWNDYQQSGQQNGQQKDNRTDTDNNGKNVNTKKKKKRTAMEKIEKEYFLELIPVDATQEFIISWTEWIDYCEEKKNKITKSTAKKQINFLLTQSNPGECIDKSIQNGWKGLFEVSDGKKSSGIRRKDYVTEDEYNSGLKTLYEARA